MQSPRVPAWLMEIEEARPLLSLPSSGSKELRTTCHPVTQVQDLLTGTETSQGNGAFLAALTVNV